MNNNMAAVGYIRVSTDVQTEKYGLPVQREEIEKYTTAHLMTLLKIFSDEGVSGASDEWDDNLAKREGFLDLLRFLDDNKEIKTVVVLNKSRLWRDDYTRIFITREFKKRKITLVSIQEPTYDLYTRNPNEMLINSIMDILDAYERVAIIAKLQNARQHKAMKTGVKPGGALPYGYRYSSTRKDVVINGREADVVRDIFNMAVEGKSLSTIAKTLTGRGLKTRRGGKWSKQTLHCMLENDFYIGVLSYGEKLEGAHEALISQEIFNKLNNKNK